MATKNAGGPALSKYEPGGLPRKQAITPALKQGPRKSGARPPGRRANEGTSALKRARAEGAGWCRRKGRVPPVVMAASRLELNLVRLLCRCEAMAAEKRDPDEWRLEKVGDPALPLGARLSQGGARPSSRTPLPMSRSGHAPSVGAATSTRSVHPGPWGSAGPASSTLAPCVFQPLTPPWLCPLRARWGGRGVPARLTPTFSPQYVGALEDMLQALKAQTR